MEVSLGGIILFLPVEPPLTGELQHHELHVRVSTALFLLPRRGALTPSLLS